MTTLHYMLPAGTPAEVIETLNAASGREEGSREKVRALLAREPPLVDRFPSLAAAAEAAILGQVSGQVVSEEAWRAQAIALRANLARPGDGELERLVIERLALAWLAVTIADFRRAARWQQEISNTAAEFWDHHLSRLNADFLRASKTLATVRRLRIPAVQVNVGAQQVNLAG